MRKWCNGSRCAPTVPRAPRLRAPPRLLRVSDLLRCLSRCLLGAGVGLDLVGGEWALRRARTAVGSPPRDGQAVARAESRQVNARDMLEVSGPLGGRAQLKPKNRR